MLKIYLKLVLLLVFVLLSFGFIMPFMISQKDTLMVVLGFAYLALGFIPGVVYGFNSIIKDLKSKVSNKQVKE